MFGLKGRLLLAMSLGSRWTLDRFCVGRRFIRLLDTLNTHSAYFLQFSFVSIRGFTELSMEVLFRVVFYLPLMY